MAAGAQTTTDDLLDAAHVPPRIHNVHLPHEPEIHTLRDLGRGDDHADQAAVHVLGVTGQGQQAGDLGGGGFRQQNVLALLALASNQERRSVVCGRVAVFLQRHGKETSPALDVIGVDQADTDTCFDGLDDGGELGRVVRELFGGQEGFAHILVLISSQLEHLSELLVAGQHRDGRHHHGLPLLVVLVVPCRLAERFALFTLDLRRHQGQVLHAVGICKVAVLADKGVDAIVGRLVGWRKTEREGERIFTLDEGDVALAPVTELRFLRWLDLAVGIEVVGGLQFLRQAQGAIVPPEQVHVVDDFFVGLVHRGRRQQDQHQAVRRLDHLLHACRHGLFHFQVAALSQIVRLVDNDQAIVKGLVDPLVGILGAHVVQRFLHAVAEGIVAHEFVELGDHAVGQSLEPHSDFGDLPLHGLGDDTSEHLQIPGARALLGGQHLARLVQLGAPHIKDLLAKVGLDGGPCDDQDLFVLELGSQNVLFGNLDGGTGLAHASAVDHEEITRRAVGGQNSTQEQLLGLEGELGRSAHFRAQRLQVLHRRGWQGVHSNLRQLGMSQIGHCFRVR